MSTHKSFASLTGSLLARKIVTRPAPDLPAAGSNDLDEVPPSFVPVEIAAPLEPLLASKPEAGAKVVPLVRPARAAVHPTGLRPLPVRRDRLAAFTLRLDPDRHLRLRLACTLSGRSAQALVAEAVDRMTAAMPEIEALAKRISAQPIVRPLRDIKP